MKKYLRKARYITVKRSIRDIENFESAPTVKTKYGKKEYELRRDMFDEEYYEHYEPTRTGWLKERIFDDYVLWGGMGGRPTKWDNEAQRKKAARIQAKLRQGQSLKEKDKEFLATLSPELVKEILEGGQQGKIGAPRKYYSDRVASPKERKREERRRKKY